MELKINRVVNGYSVVVYRGKESGESYSLDNTDEVLGRAVSLIIDYFRADGQQLRNKPILEKEMEWKRRCLLPKQQKEYELEQN